MQMFFFGGGASFNIWVTDLGAVNFLHWNKRQLYSSNQVINTFRDISNLVVLIIVAYIVLRF